MCLLTLFPISVLSVRLFSFNCEISPLISCPGFFIGSIFASSYELTIALQVVGFSIGLLSPMVFNRIKAIPRLPINMEHIVERFALFR